MQSVLTAFNKKLIAAAPEMYEVLKESEKDLRWAGARLENMERFESARILLLQADKIAELRKRIND